MKANSIKALLLSHGFGQGVTVVIQLLNIPVLIHYMGGEAAGVWLTIGAVAALLNTTDFGFYNVIGNKLVRARTVGSVREYEDLRKDLIRITMAMSLGILILNSIISFFATGNSVMEGRSQYDLPIAVFIVSISTALGFAQNLQKTYMRVEGRLAYCHVILNIQRLAGFIVLLLILQFTKSFMAIAVGGLVVIMMSYRVLNQYYTDPNYIFDAPLSYWRSLKLNFSNCFTASAFTVANSLVSHGFTMILACHASGRDVIIYNAYRIVGRPSLQLSVVIAQSIWPRCSELFAQNDPLSAERTVNKALLVYGGLSLAGGILLYFIMPYVWPVYVRNEFSWDWCFGLVTNIDAIMLGVINISFGYLVAIGEFNRLGKTLLVISVGIIFIAFWVVNSAFTAALCSLSFSFVSIVALLLCKKSK